MKTAIFLTDEQIDIIECALENSIDSNIDWLNSCCEDKDEKKHLIKEQKELFILIRKHGVETTATIGIKKEEIKNEKIM